ncbi:hypothetical protein [Bremerella sp. P1]|uniref:hypothetical protein n=1 Tax=Bremerella sp. P1 TaxID=3026424 RepID=UPI0023678335|nr:hypothetical protein [Bremerella sp. P1]WDI44753.1 hypothetical protein PSR63_12485 [Bremerella sp. P1]
MCHVEILDASPVQEPEKEMVWPQLRLCEGFRRVFFTEEVALTDVGVQLAGAGRISRVDSFCYSTPPANTQWQIRITAEDGSEYPRVEKIDLGGGDNATWLRLNGNDNGSVLIACDPGYGPFGIGEMSEHGLMDSYPLPKGTITTITVSEGKVSAEIEEPKPAFPYRLKNGAVLVKHPCNYQIFTSSGEKGGEAGFVTLDDLKQAVAYIKEHAND